MASGDGAIYIVDRESWRLIKIINLSQRSARSLQLDEHHIYAGYSDGYVRVMDKKLQTYSRNTCSQKFYF